MSIEENKSLVHRYIEEIWNKGDLSVVDELIASDFIHHGLDRERRGPDQFKEFVSSTRTTFPDLRFTPRNQIAERDIVVSHWIMSATHTVEFMGIAPTNKKFRIPGASIARLAGGKVSENWVYWDRLGLLRRLGVTLPR